VLILDPGWPIGAAEAYEWLAEDRVNGASDAPGARVFPGPGALARWDVLARLAGNDLEEPVFRRHPDLRRLRDALRDAGAEIALLCGSGSCVAGVFVDDRSRDAAAGAAARLPARVIFTRTMGRSATDVA
jgi:4-diphosphocytidyl-2C-methyl-D-erythritol kinase